MELTGITIITILLTVLLLIVIPIVVNGELLYRIPRKRLYKDLSGYTEHTVQSQDGVNITFWESGRQFNKVLLITHGHWDNSGLLQQRFHEITSQLDVDIIYIDLRNHGRSAYRYPVTIGVFEQFDVCAVLEWIHLQHQWTCVYVYGTSMGAASALLASRKTHVPICKLLLDSLFLDVKNAVKRNLNKYWLYPWTPAIIWYLFSFRFNNQQFPDIEDALQQTTIPLLIMQGTNDKITVPENITAIQQLQNPNITCKLITNGTHSRLFKHEDYINAFVDFFS